MRKINLLALFIRFERINLAKSEASSVSRINGTTSMAENDAEIAIDIDV